MSNYKKSTHGFTLLEILLVVGIIAVLAGIVIIAINPSRQLAFARNTERKSDIKQIKSAMEQFYIDKGYYPASTTLSATTTLQEICDTGATSSPSGVTCTDMIDLSELVPVYITAIPRDPQATTTSGAGYKVVKHSSGKIGLKATAELGQIITLNIPPEEVVVEVDPCAGTPVAGTVCTDGTVYVSATLRTTPSDAGAYRWGPQSNVTGATDVSDGRNNITILKALSPDLSLYQAAQVCDNSTANGQSDWYLPAKDDLNTLFINRVAIGNFNTSGSWPGSYYWSSTEFNDGAAWIQNFSGILDGSSTVKLFNLSVRCVRRP